VEGILRERLFYSDALLEDKTLFNEEGDFIPEDKLLLNGEILNADKYSFMAFGHYCELKEFLEGADPLLVQLHNFLAYAKGQSEVMLRL
jgi:hypothetical protein